MKFTVIDKPHQNDFERWSKFVNSHPRGNIFQTPQIFHFYNTIANYQPLIFYAIGDDQKPVGVLLAILIGEAGITGFFSKRCIIWGGPIAKDDDLIICRQLLIALNKSVKRQAIYTEIRNLFDLESMHSSIAESGFAFKDHLNYVVKLDSEDNVRKRMSNSKWRQIKKSFSEGARIIIPEKIEEVKSFYEILRDLYKNKVKKPLPSWSFFEEFFLSQDLGKYFLIEFQGRIIGGIMCPIYKNRIYELYVAGLDREFKKIYPSVLATWAPIQYGLENGLEYFDFMGAGSPGADYGVREFKEKFGGEQVNYGRYLLINKPLLYSIGKTGLSIYQKIS